MGPLVLIVKGLVFRGLTFKNRCHWGVRYRYTQKRKVVSTPKNSPFINQQFLSPNHDFWSPAVCCPKVYNSRIAPESLLSFSASISTFPKQKIDTARRKMGFLSCNSQCFCVKAYILKKNLLTNYQRCGGKLCTFDLGMRATVVMDALPLALCKYCPGTIHGSLLREGQVPSLGVSGSREGRGTTQADYPTNRTKDKRYII